VTHLAGELLQRESGIELLHVPYRSTANSLTDLVGGHIDAIFGDVAILKPHVNSGAIRALAITSDERSPLLPELPTMAEAGFPKVHTEVWYGLLAPARTPAPVLAKLKAAVAAAQADPAFHENLRKFGIRPATPGADSFAAFIHDEVARWTPIVTSIKPNEKAAAPRPLKRSGSGFPCRLISGFDISHGRRRTRVSRRQKPPPLLDRRQGRFAPERELPLPGPSTWSRSRASSARSPDAPGWALACCLLEIGAGHGERFPRSPRRQP
jgi:hypothetical protein